MWRLHKNVCENHGSYYQQVEAQNTTWGLEEFEKPPQSGYFRTGAIALSRTCSALYILQKFPPKLYFVPLRCPRRPREGP